MPVWANSLWDPISKITRAKWTEGVAQVLECPLCKHEAQVQSLSSLSPPKKSLLN
jgi:hypothetical protein